MARGNTGTFLRYALLPGIIPRIITFFTSGFSIIALYMAYVYRAVRLLPAGHPYLNPVNAGRFGIRHVVFEARRNLVMSRENLDQIIIFFALLAGIIILFMQFALFIGGVFMTPALAGPGAYYASFFVTANPTFDLAFRMLDLTFGFGDPRPIFNSCAIQGVQCQLAFTPPAGYTQVGPTYTVPNQFHLALHALFQFYNVGILVVGFMIAMYMVVTVVAETAQSGTPFGRRFNHAWAPIRLVVAIALLTPLTYGLNGAQLLTLMVAKWGSGLATNGWEEFSTALNHMPIQEGAAAPATLVARPDNPEINNLIEFIFVAQTCMFGELYMNGRGAPDGNNQPPLPITGPNPRIKAYQVFPDRTGGAFNAANIRADFVAGDFNNALTRANNGDIVIRFGAVDDVNYNDYAGHVKPICGELIFNTKDVTQPGAFRMQEEYYDIVVELFEDPLNLPYADNVAKRMLPIPERDPYADIPDQEFIDDTYTYFNARVEAAVTNARTDQVNADWPQNYLVLGWVGAGMWYQRIAEYTGSLYAAVYGIPTPNLFPTILEQVKDQRRVHNDFVEGKGRYDPVLTNGQMVEFEAAQDEQLAQTYYFAQTMWQSGYEQPSGNTFLDSILSIFGLTGLFEMQENRDIHPLAQLVGVGRSLVESAVTNLGFSFGSGVTGGIANILGYQLVGSVALAASSFAGQVALIGLGIGFILFYILPFLPFIYFFFAAGGWVKGIFEAMVGLPLFALAHIRIDGEGLPGAAAMNGYFLVFEIMIRPILIVVGLIGSIAIFTALVQVLNDIWPLVTSNVMGYDRVDMASKSTPGTGALTGVAPEVGSIEYLRNAADQLFFTVMYAIVCYMMAMSSFKLIDLIPNNILRWLGTSVATFGDHSGDPAQSLVQYSFFGSQLAMGPMNRAISGIAARATPGQ